MKQNIYDNPFFFENYKDLRDNDKGLNGAIELPAIRKLIVNIGNSIILDLGCGLGHQIQYLLEHKAKRIIGVDISDNMIIEAQSRIQSEKVAFICKAIEDYEIEKNKFDIILSSMMFHYVKDLDVVFENVFNGLKIGGQFVFSIEHPVCTAYLNRWIDTNEGKVWPIAHYSQEGIRYHDWFVSGVQKYHRKISSVVNSLIKSGFTIKRVEEPEPTDEIIDKRPELIGHIERPSVLIIKAVK